MWDGVARIELLSLCPRSQPFDPVGGAIAHSAASSLRALCAVGVSHTHFSFCTASTQCWVSVSCSVSRFSSVGPYAACFCTISSENIARCRRPPPHFSAHLPRRQSSRPTQMLSARHLSCALQADGSTPPPPAALVLCPPGRRLHPPPPPPAALVLCPFPCTVPVWLPRGWCARLIPQWRLDNRKGS